MSAQRFPVTENDRPFDATPRVRRPSDDALGPEGRASSQIFRQASFVAGTLRRFGVRACDVDDAAQRVFLTAANRIADIAVGSERAFLYTVALREAGHVRRSYRRSRETLEDLHEEPAPASLQQDELVARKRAHALARAVLHVLDEDCRRAFTLCELEGRTTSEVARELGAPLGTIKTRLRRARSTLATLNVSHAARLAAK
jgi:RNA polymerase sigma-70 factor (ECF subfamily)